MWPAPPINSSRGVGEPRASRRASRGRGEQVGGAVHDEGGHRDLRQAAPNVERGHSRRARRRPCLRSPTRAARARAPPGSARRRARTSTAPRARTSRARDHAPDRTNPAVNGATAPGTNGSRAQSSRAAVETSTIPRTARPPPRDAGPRTRAGPCRPSSARRARRRGGRVASTTVRTSSARLSIDRARSVGAVDAPWPAMVERDRANPGRRAASRNCLVQIRDVIASPWTNRNDGPWPCAVVNRTRRRRARGDPAGRVERQRAEPADVGIGRRGVRHVAEDLLGRRRQRRPRARRRREPTPARRPSSSTARSITRRRPK